MRGSPPLLLLGRKSKAVVISALAAAAIFLVQAVPAERESPTDLSEGRGLALASAPGRIYFGHEGDIWVAEAGSISQLTQGGRYWGQPDASPDGTEVALVGWNSSSSDVFVMNVDGSDLRQLTRSQQRLLRNNDWVFLPRWSPDGELIAYVSDRASAYPMLWTMLFNGANARQILPPRGNLDGIDAYTWSPDGARIAATRFDASTSQIQLIELAAPARSRAITNEPGGAFDPAWSPDGANIAYAARDGRRVVIKVIDSQGVGPPTTLVQTDMGRAPRWSPSGSALAYVALVGRQFEVLTVDINTDRDGALVAGRPSQITSQFGVDATSGLSWAP
jgi:TolB protein